MTELDHGGRSWVTPPCRCVSGYQDSSVWHRNETVRMYMWLPVEVEVILSAQEVFKQTKVKHFRNHLMQAWRCAWAVMEIVADTPHWVWIQCTKCLWTSWQWLRAICVVPPSTFPFMPNIVESTFYGWRAHSIANEEWQCGVLFSASAQRIFIICLHHQTNSVPNSVWTFHWSFTLLYLKAWLLG